MLSVYLALIDDEGSRTKFEQLYLLHAHTMIHVAKNILHDRMLAEDVVHDAFLHIMNRMDKISEPDCSKTRSFVVLIVRNIAINYYRKQKRQSEANLEDYSEYLTDDQMDPESAHLQKEDFQAMLTKIAHLKPSYVDILSLKVAFEYSDLEIAQLLGITSSNVRVRLHRARNSLGLVLKREDV